MRGTTVMDIRGCIECRIQFVFIPFTFLIINQWGILILFVFTAQILEFSDQFI